MNLTPKNAGWYPMWQCNPSAEKAAERCSGCYGSLKLFRENIFNDDYG